MLAPFILLLRWLAYVGTKDDAETIYILTEEEYATNFDGVDEAIMEDLGRYLGGLRQRAKGGAR